MGSLEYGRVNSISTTSPNFNSTPAIMHIPYSLISVPRPSLIRDGRGTEISEYGMCIMAGVELKFGDVVEIEFTLPYSSEPIRVPGAVRNRDGYRYGCEFALDGQGERKDVSRLRQAL